MPNFDLDAWRLVEAAVRLEDGRQRRAGLPPQQRFRALHPASAEFIFLLALATRAQRIVEIGTSAGYSALWLARACALTGGSLVTVERNPVIVDVAADHLKSAGVADLVDIKVGDARETLTTLDGPFDLAFVDGEKDEYAAYGELLWPRLAAGASLVADNVLSHADEAAPFLDWLHSRADAATTVLEIGNGLSWTVKGNMG
ncbi:MAG: class I SAM-dependent methyltransferase [bacterium]